MKYSIAKEQLNDLDGFIHQWKETWGIEVSGNAYEQLEVFIFIFINKVREEDRKYYFDFCNVLADIHEKEHYKNNPQWYGGNINSLRNIANYIKNGELNGDTMPRAEKYLQFIKEESIKVKSIYEVPEEIKEDIRREGILQYLHPTALSILELMKKKDINGMTLREIGALVGVEHPQKIKHHINHLINVGFVNIIKGKKVLADYLQSIKEESK